MPEQDPDSDDADTTRGGLGRTAEQARGGLGRTAELDGPTR
jgi:hypothetical protein